jgi:general secretion pathway protein L
MNILIIDIGSYAVKFLEIELDRKEPIIVSHHYVVLSRVRPQLKPDLTQEAVQQEIVRSYLKHNPFEGKIIFQIPDFLVTSRFITLPVGNRRKAEMMIPFQLDDNLPFPTSKAHYTTTLQRVGPNETIAEIAITELETFDAFYHSLVEKDILPAVLTSELSIVHSFADAAQIAGPMALLDIGHETSKCYFIFNKQVVSNHLSYTAGECIDEMLQTTYDLSPEDAVVYKHENSFFLTEAQYNGVTEEQKHFAHLMKEVFSPLVQDLKRWEVGFRVKYGHPVEKIYITGATSKIKNLAPFLSESLGLKVEVYNPYQLNHVSSTPVADDNQHSFALCSMAAYAHKGKIPLSNFLHGAYRSNYNTNIPPHSTTFIFTRVLILCLLLSGLLLIERFAFLMPKDEALTTMASRDAAFSQPERNLYRRNPQRLLSQFRTQSRQISQEVRLVQSASTTDALSALTTLSASLSSNPKIDLVFFRSQDRSVEARFQSEELRELELLSDHLLTRGLPDLFVELDTNNKTLEISFRGGHR